MTTDREPRATRSSRTTHAARPSKGINLMSKKTKRLAKGLGASALAIATIASGLSFGALLRLHALSTTWPDLVGTEVVKLAGTLDGRTFQSWKPIANSGLLHGSYSSPEAASAAATPATVSYFSDGSFSVNASVTAADSSGSTSRDSLTTHATALEHDSVKIHADASKRQRPSVKFGQYFRNGGKRLACPSGGSGSFRFVGIRASFSGAVESLDIPARTAVVKGRGCRVECRSAVGGR